MTTVLGRPAGESGPEVSFGRYRAADGSAGAPVALDVDRPHAGLVVGKRGSGKSYTLGVVAEGLADAPGVRGVVVDPMGAFGTLAECGARVVREPRVSVDALPPAGWCDLLGVDPTGPVGALLWRAAAESESLGEAYAAVREASATGATRRAARNHLDLAAGWDVFDADGPSPVGAGTEAGAKAEAGLVVYDLSRLDRRPCGGCSPAAVTRA